jgi:ribose transport system substrate-binding protein
MSFEQPDLPSAAPGRRVLLALVDKTQEYQQHQAAQAEAAAARAGISLETVFAENNAIAQIYQVFGRLHAAPAERPTVIIAHPVAGDALERVGRGAVKEGVGWIVLNRRAQYLDELRALAPGLLVSSVTPDNPEIGRLQGQQVRKLAPARGSLLIYIQGPPDTSAAQDRLRGCQEALGDCCDWKTLHADWTETGGEKAVVAFLRLKTNETVRPVAVVAQNDAMAIGARRAIAAMRPAWISTPFLGCDGLPAVGQRLVDGGELAGTVVMPSTAGRAIDLVGAWLDRGTQPPPSVMIPPSFYAPAAPQQAGVDAKRANTV